MNKPEESEALSGTKLPLRVSIDLISFTAQVDFSQNSEFIDLLKPQNLVNWLQFDYNFYTNVYERF